MVNRAGWHLTMCLFAAYTLAGLGACSVYDASKLSGVDGNKPPPDGKGDAGMDAAMPPPKDSSVDASDGAMACVPTTEICNDKDDDCDGKVDETAAATAYCAMQRPHTTNVMCASGGICFSMGCQPGYDDLDGQPQNGCEKCPGGSCDDAGTDDGGTL